jgi:3-deoxy-7-phosphoheptulonate synthase
MLDTTDDIRTLKTTPLATPAELCAVIPRTPAMAACVAQSRRAVHNILHGQDDRLLVVIGPCSIHDPAAALDYASRLAAQRARLGDALEIVMRVYFEKPRTTIGWKGLINDPHLNGSCEIAEGLRIARTLLADINARGVPAGCEFLDVLTPLYIADLVSWGAIGARTTESQVHRQLASGLPCAVGLKNGTNGDVGVAVDAVLAASYPHHFLSSTPDGRTAITATAGNEDCHVILRGGAMPNYDSASIATTATLLQRAGLPARIVIDASHGNSGKNHARQPVVAADVARQISSGDHRIVGLMLESNILAGRQDQNPGKALTYGQSITDACLGWEDSVDVLEDLAEAIRARRAHRTAA